MSEVSIILLQIHVHGGLTIKSIDLCDLSTLVVSSEQDYLVWVHGLQGQQLSEGLQTVVASIHKISLH